MPQIDRIDPTKTAMIVVDMQNDFVAQGAPMETPAARAMVPKLAEALKICRGHGIKVIYTTHVHRRDGCDTGLFNMHPPIEWQRRCCKPSFQVLVSPSWPLQS